VCLHIWTVTIRRTPLHEIVEERYRIELPFVHEFIISHVHAELDKEFVVKYFNTNRILTATTTVIIERGIIVIEERLWNASFSPRIHVVPEFGYDWKRIIHFGDTPKYLFMSVW